MRRPHETLRVFGAFVRWIFAGPWFAVTPQFAVLGIALWLLAGAPASKFGDGPTATGSVRVAAVTVGAALIVLLIAYWHRQVRRDEPPRIRSRWDRRRD